MGEQKTFAKVKLDFESNHRIGDALAIPISYIVHSSILGQFRRHFMAVLGPFQVQTNWNLNQIIA